VKHLIIVARSAATVRTRLTITVDQANHAWPPKRHLRGLPPGGGTVAPLVVWTINHFGHCPNSIVDCDFNARTFSAASRKIWKIGAPSTSLLRHERDDIVLCHSSALYQTR
jgi:hypothetical protein